MIWRGKNMTWTGRGACGASESAAGIWEVSPPCFFHELRLMNIPCPHIAEFHEEAFSHFISSLKWDRTYAPSYTSLGIYYSEFADPPDPTRASKCFQKAFELDPREADAAKRLAEGFADEREWDLVEVVARRTIDGEGGLDAGIQTGDGVTVGRYLPTNAWAWKAVGVVELVS
jgi:superkiller protein 3